MDTTPDLKSIQTQENFSSLVQTEPEKKSSPENDATEAEKIFPTGFRVENQDICQPIKLPRLFLVVTFDIGGVWGCTGVQNHRTVRAVILHVCTVPNSSIKSYGQKSESKKNIFDLGSKLMKNYGS